MYQKSLIQHLIKKSTFVTQVFYTQSNKPVDLFALQGAHGHVGWVEHELAGKWGVQIRIIFTLDVQFVLHCQFVAPPPRPPRRVSFTEPPDRLRCLLRNNVRYCVKECV